MKAAKHPTVHGRPPYLQPHLTIHIHRTKNYLVKNINNIEVGKPLFRMIMPGYHGVVTAFLKCQLISLSSIRLLVVVGNKIVPLYPPIYFLSIYDISPY